MCFDLAHKLDMHVKVKPFRGVLHCLLLGQKVHIVKHVKVVPKSTECYRDVNLILCHVKVKSKAKDM